MRKKLLIGVIVLIGLGLSIFGAYQVYAGTRYDDGILVIDDDNVYPKTDSVTELGKSGNEWEDIYCDAITLGGTQYTSLAAGSDGNWTGAGNTTTLDAAPTKFICTHSTGQFLATIIDTDDITGTTNDQTIDLSTDGKVIFGDNSDTLTIYMDGTDVQIVPSDGSITFDCDDGANGTVDFKTANDDDDYLIITTSGNIPAITTAAGGGDGDLSITADGGDISFGDENLVTTGTLGAGATTLSSTLSVGGIITLQSGETVVNSTDDTVYVKSDDNDLNFQVRGHTAKNGVLEVISNNDGAAGDQWKLQATHGDKDLKIYNDATLKLTMADTTGNILTTGDITIAGTTPILEIGDGDAEDTALFFDGNAVDYHLALDDSDDYLVIGSGTSYGTTSAQMMYFDYSTYHTTIENNDATANAVEDVLTVSKGTSGATTAGIGAAISFNVEDGGGIEQQASIDVAMTDVTDGGEDADIIFSQNVAGTITERCRMDADGANLLLSGATPYITIGDAGAEDTKIVYDGNVQDFYSGLDDTGGTTEDEFILAGLGSAVGTTPVIQVTSGGAITTNYDITMIGSTPVLTVGDGGAEDTYILFNGDDQDYYMGVDDSDTGEFALGYGSSMGTNQRITITSGGTMSLTGTGIITATNIADATREIIFTPADFLLSDSLAPELTYTSTPGLEVQNNLDAIVWADGETTSAQVTLIVPADYASGGTTFYALCDSNAVTTASQVDFDVYLNTDDAAAWDNATTNQTPVALSNNAGSPEQVTLTVGTDLASLSAGQSITLRIWRDDTADGTDNLELYSLRWRYTSTQ